MRSGLYYPHTTIRNESIVKTALLLWDKLEFIVPWQGFQPKYVDRDIAEAMEFIGLPISPNEAEKKEADARIGELIDRSLPTEFFFPTAEKKNIDYEMYSQKLLDETWSKLRRSRIIRRASTIPGFAMEKAIGLTLMSILADCCAGETKCRVTDKGAAYAALAGFRGDTETPIPMEQQASEAQFVSISLKMIDTSQIGLKALVKFRQQEDAESQHTLRDLRHRYLTNIENYVKRLVTEKSTERDAIEIKRQFDDDMKADLEHLRQELGFVNLDTLLSKEFLVTTLASIGTVATSIFGTPVEVPGVATATGAVIAVGGLLSVRNKYLSARRGIMQKHPMAYMLELHQHAHQDK